MTGRKAGKAPSAPAPGAVPFDLAKEERLRKVLDAFGYTFREPPPPATVLFAEGEGANVALYRTGRLLVQGKRAREALAELAAFELVPGPGPGPAPGPDREAAPDAAPTSASPGAATPSSPLIGSDESGKGDYFGPLVVAAAHVEPATWGRLRALGVRDSKALSDRAVHAMVEDVRRLCPHVTVAIGPARYNELRKTMGNVNRLLAWAHARAIEDLLGRVACDRVLIDQFADASLVERALMDRGRRVTVSQRPRAEEETAVAAASVIARATFLEMLKKLSDRFGIELPKGASTRVEEVARDLFARHGAGGLREAAKLHFRTTERVAPSLFGAEGS